MDPAYLDFRFNLPITVFFEVEVPKGPTPAQGLFKCRCIADQLTPAQPMSTPGTGRPNGATLLTKKARRSVSSDGPHSAKWTG